MSRFTPARRAAIAVWTGASVVWATALTTFAVEEPKGSDPGDAGNPGVVSGVPAPSFPTRPESGLVIIRQAGSPPPKRVEEAVIVERSQPAAAVAVAPPQPTTSGS